MMRQERWIQHYSSSQRILLVGEGDFSFSACLARAFGSGSNMVATSKDSKEILRMKHWSSEENLQELKRLNCLVLHEIDVRNMNHDPILKRMKFDVIVFNFPHAGHFCWLRERDAALIRMHKRLLAAYFRSAREMLRRGGEIHVTHRDDYPYNTWEVVKLAADAGLQLKEKVRFLKSNYPGYHNKRGSYIKSNQKFPIDESYTFKFVLNSGNNTINADDEAVDVIIRSAL